LINVNPKATLPSELVIIAPAGFNFTDDCLFSGGINDEITACTRIENLEGLTNSPPRARARLVCKAGGLTEPTQYVQIYVVTPALSVEKPAWYVEVKGPEFQLGWGTDPVGIEVEQMVESGVVYPGIPGISGLMAFRFIMIEKVAEHGVLRIGYPKSFTIECAGDFLSKVALEGDIVCNHEPKLGYFELNMSRPLPPGQQAFAVTSIAPPAVNEANVFSIKVLSPSRDVVDAAMNIPGRFIQHGLPLTTMPLIWSSSEASKSALITLGFELLQELPEEDPPTMSELVVEVPRDFQQQIFRAAHFEMSGTDLPVRDGAWLDVSHPQRVRVLLDEAQTKVLPVGQYGFSFPVMLPARMPAYNVWLLTVCGPAPTGVNESSCTGSEDPRALVSYPMAGFALGETHPSAVQYMTGRASHLGTCGLLMPAALLLLSSARWAWGDDGS
jgi:hypothetical protein